MTPAAVVVPCDVRDADGSSWNGARVIGRDDGLPILAASMLIASNSRVQRLRSCRGFPSIPFGRLHKTPIMISGARGSRRAVLDHAARRG